MEVTTSCSLGGWLLRQQLAHDCSVLVIQMADGSSEDEVRKAAESG